MHALVQTKYVERTINFNSDFFFLSQTNQILHSNGENCLTLTEGSDVLTIAPCEGEIAQQWYVGPPSYQRTQI